MEGLSPVQEYENIGLSKLVTLAGTTTLCIAAYPQALGL
jgi:hypothetical protein